MSLFLSHDAQPIPPWQCPTCRHTNDMAACFNEVAAPQPNPGDVLICAYCATLVLLEANGQVREPTGLERAGLPHEIREAHYAVKTFRAFMQEEK